MTKRRLKVEFIYTRSMDEDGPELVGRGYLIIGQEKISRFWEDYDNWNRGHFKSILMKNADGSWERINLDRCESVRTMEIE